MLNNILEKITEFSLQYKRLLLLTTVIAAGVFIFSIITGWLFFTKLTGYLALGIAVVSASLVSLAYYNENKAVSNEKKTENKEDVR